MKNCPAFTLIEFLIVFTIIVALVAGAGLSFSQGYRSLTFKNNVEEALSVFRTARSYATSSRIIESYDPDIPPPAFTVEITGTAIEFYPSDGTCSDTGTPLSPRFTIPANLTVATATTANKILWTVPYGDVVLCNDDAESADNELTVELRDPLPPIRSRTIMIDRVGGIPELQS